jgi:drug/metabolite transporter (DMT)-like permease
MTHQYRQVFAALLCTVLFSISALCGHRSARLIGGTEANFWRVTAALVVLGVWAYGWGIGLSGSAFPLFLLSGIIGIGIGDVAYFQALPRLGPRLSVLVIHCCTAPCGALLEWLWLGTTFSAKQGLWGLTALAGVAIALSPGEHVKRSHQALLHGAIGCAVASIAGAVGAVLSRKAYAVAHLNGESIDGANAAFQRVVGGALISAFCLLIVKRRAFKIQSRAPYELVVQASKKKWRGVWFWVLANSLAGQTIGVSFMQRALETTPTGIVLSIIAITPIVVIPFAVVFEKERPSPRSLVGGLIAVTGVVELVLSRS